MTQKLIEEYLISTGSTWISQSQLAKWCKRKRCTITLQDLRNSIEKKEIVFTKYHGENYFSLPFYHKLENDVAKKLIALVRAGVQTPSFEWVKEKITEIEKEIGITLHVEQKNGVFTAINNAVSIITGGPGTGKTSVLTFIQRIMKSYGLDVCYMAPTGKASKRITESTGSPAYTMHKKMKIYQDSSKPMPLKERVIIIDESSMSDIFIVEKLLTAISIGTRLIFVGDIFQLPSAGMGSILRDLINSSFIPTVKLEKTFRQLSDSNILNNIQKLKNCDMNFTTGDNFRVYKNMSPDKASAFMVDLYLKRVAEYGIDNVACLTPYRKSGFCCSDKMNRKIQNIINPGNAQKPQILANNWVLRRDDIVIQLQNRDECVNGDVGKIVDIGKNNCTVKYTDSTVNYWKKDLDQLSLAYALTVHKSQGSEYKSVITCLLNEHTAMFQRNLPYTAVTRAKECCDFIFDDKALSTALKTEASDMRVTMLSQKLESCIK